jgi:hypothetical protein
MSDRQIQTFASNSIAANTVSNASFAAPTSQMNSTTPANAAPYYNYYNYNNQNVLSQYSFFTSQNCEQAPTAHYPNYYSNYNYSMYPYQYAPMSNQTDSNNANFYFQYAQNK